MDESRLNLPKFNTIGLAERINLSKAMKAPLSGYLGGIHKGGYWVEKLSNDWCEKFGCKYAIPCNSATSGLLAACMALGIGPGSVVWVSATTMSATAACAKVLGAHIVFIDIERIRFSMNMNQFRGAIPKLIIVTNLFGHPAYLSSMRSWCDSNKVWMVEDAAQSPFAMENGKYAGTVGHIGIFSYNVHKAIQAGEGGVAVTNDDNLALRLKDAINHGECRSDGIVGLNLRMSEPIAAIACAQLARAKTVIESRIALAEELTDMVSDIPWIHPQIADTNCVHVYYKWVAIVDDRKRKAFVDGLKSYGFPMEEGYSPLLNRVFKTDDKCPVAEKVEDEELINFEVCGWDPNKKQLGKMREIVKRVAGDMT